MDKKLLYEKLMSRLRRDTCLLSPLDILYQQEYSGPYTDLSYYGDDCIVIAALKDDKITGFGRPVLAVGTDKSLKAQFQRLYDISHDILYMDLLWGGAVSAACKFLLQKGLVARPHFTQVIDLTKTEAELHVNLRKSYTSLINKDIEDCAIIDNLFWWHSCTFLECKKLHTSVRGAQTRSGKTWKYQWKMIDDFQAFAIVFPRSMPQQLKTFGLFYYNDYNCYYAVAASATDSCSHAILWKAILHAKFLGCKTFEMGEQVFSGDEKLVNISKFKRGFGGDCKTRLLIGEKDGI